MIRARAWWQFPDVYKGEAVQLGLSFIVFGVPRSGTKGLVRALNLHPNVLCASERFSHTRDHGRLTYPRDFLGARGARQPMDARKLTELRSLAVQKPQVQLVGNKSPRYYLDLSRINAEVPGLRNLMIYRSPYGFMPSWNRREQSHRASRWRAGDVGLFGFLDLLCCLHAAIARDDIFLFPYSAGLNESAGPILDAVAYLGADPDAYDRETFEREHLPRKAESHKRSGPERYELEMLDRLGVGELDALMESGWGPLAESTRAQIKDYLISIRPGLPSAIDDAFAQCDNPAARDFGAGYWRARRRSFPVLAQYLEPARAIADLASYSPRRRVRNAYRQRFLLEQRVRPSRAGMDDSEDRQERKDEKATKARAREAKAREAQVKAKARRAKARKAKEKKAKGKGRP